MPTIADAGEDDLPGILAIYNDVIARTTAVYQEEPVTLDNRRAWFASRRVQGYPVLAARDETGVVGFASPSATFASGPATGTRSSTRSTSERTAAARAWDGA
jgi:L-amino acid N-acyltransferase YncA